MDQSCYADRLRSYLKGRYGEIRHFASELNVSKSAVSLFINNKHLGDATFKKINAALPKGLQKKENVPLKRCRLSKAAEQRLFAETDSCLAELRLHHFARGRYTAVFERSCPPPEEFCAANGNRAEVFGREQL